jgi:hypothetical protein
MDVVCQNGTNLVRSPAFWPGKSGRMGEFDVVGEMEEKVNQNLRSQALTN